MHVPSCAYGRMFVCACVRARMHVFVLEPRFRRADVPVCPLPMMIWSKSGALKLPSPVDANG
eukprot:3253619-Pleurochrysis_carterae.AAC.1